MAEYIDRCDSCIHDEVCDLWDKVECQDARCYSQLIDGSCGCYRNKNDVAPVVWGTPKRHYIRYYNSDGEVVREVADGWECSICGAVGAENYCPNCGAKMGADGE